MNAKERDIVAYLICISEESGVPVRNAIKELSKSDPKFFATYETWKRTIESSADLVAEYHRQMCQEFGADWEMKRTKPKSDEIWANIVKSA